MNKIPEERLVYIDETGIDDSLQRPHGWAPKGQKVSGEIAGKRCERRSVVAGLQNKKHVAVYQFNGTMNAELFETWFETCLLSEIKKDSVVILDNARFHRKDVLKKLAKKYGVEIIFLPAYSPHLNPIEKSWANLKRWLRDNRKKYRSLKSAINAYFKREQTVIEI